MPSYEQIGVVTALEVVSLCQHAQASANIHRSFLLHMIITVGCDGKCNLKNIVIFNQVAHFIHVDVASHL